MFPLLEQFVAEFVLFNLNEALSSCLFSVDNNFQLIFVDWDIKSDFVAYFFSLNEHFQFNSTIYSVCWLSGEWIQIWWTITIYIQNRIVSFYIRYHYRFTLVCLRSQMCFVVFSLSYKSFLVFFCFFFFFFFRLFLALFFVCSLRFFLRVSLFCLVLVLFFPFFLFCLLFSVRFFYAIIRFNVVNHIA